MVAARVAVVGGGLAGLAAAQTLQQAGFTVDLFERSRLLGGRATSFEVDGRVVDNGQHVYLACCTQFIDFVRAAGMGRFLYQQDRFAVEVYSAEGTRSALRAADLPPPFHLLASFVFYRHLGWRAKGQIARALIELLRTPEIPADETFACWLDRAGQGEEAVRAFWDPFLVPALNAPLDRMSAAEAAFVVCTAFLRDRDAARFGYALVPLARIMEAAASRLHAVHRSVAVSKAEVGNRIVLQTPSSRHEFDGAVLAVPPRALERMLGDPAALGIPPLHVYEPFAIMDVHLWHDRSALAFDFAALLESPVQWIFQKAPGYLCCSASAASDLARMPSARAATLVWDELRRRLPPLREATLLQSAVTRNPEGTYLCAPGAARPGPQTSARNLTIAGSWTATGWPDTMESAVRSGKAAACSLMEAFAAR